MDQTPTTIDQDNVDPLRDKLTSMLQELDSVSEVEVRLREEGQVYFGDLSFAAFRTARRPLQAP
jgi:hypothetical protein